MAINTLPFYLTGAVESWFYSLDDTVKRYITTIKEATHQLFQQSSQNNLELMNISSSNPRSHPSCHSDDHRLVSRPGLASDGDHQWFEAFFGPDIDKRLYSSQLG